MRFLSHQIKAAQGARDRNEIADAPNLIGSLISFERLSLQSPRVPRAPVVLR